MALDVGTCLRYYKRRDIQDALIGHAKNKEIGVRYTEQFGKRPDILQYPQEILELAKAGATSVHCSEELWDNPLSIGTNLTKKDLDALRSGWDLVLDIDCKFLEYSKLAADLIIKYLQYSQVESVSVKFSGNKGFHIGVPFEAFPQKVGQKLTKDMFPEAPRKIAFLVKEKIKEELARKILELEGNNFHAIVEKVGLQPEQIIYYQKTREGDSIARLLVDSFLEIDTVLLSSRHLYRMPYSLHEKSGLVSMPLSPSQVLQFEKSMANPDAIRPTLQFMERAVKTESARRLLLQALDFDVKIAASKPDMPQREEMRIESPIQEDFFPPCMKLIVAGLEDGKKRALFCLANYLGKIGWSREDSMAYIAAWNKQKNVHDPLRENYIQGQLVHFKAGERLPPNCNNEAYYKGIGVCKPDALCAKIKNPVNYTLIKWKRHLEEKALQEEINMKEMKKEERARKQAEKEKMVTPIAGESRVDALRQGEPLSEPSPKSL